MTYFIGLLLLLIVGYVLVILLGVTRNNLLYDLSIGWFLGAGYYSWASFIFYYGLGFSVRPIYSFIIMLIPLIIGVSKYTSFITKIRHSYKGIMTTRYLEFKSSLFLDILMIVYSLIILILIVIHGTSTPSTADDALHLRAYTPMLAYDDYITGEAERFIFRNGIWPTFITVLFWHIKGSIEHFYVNYTIITSLFFFLCILYLAPAIKGDYRRGIYNIFLVLSIPLFVYHLTATYADARMTMPFAIGFLFFSFYVRGRDKIDLKTMILFFTITCFIKDRGEIAGITGMCLILFHTIYSYYREKKFPVMKIMPIFLPFLIYFTLRNYYSGNLLSLFGVATDATVHLFDTVILTDKIKSVREYMLGGFNESLFLSGNFGILFYVLAANIVLFYKRIINKTNIWEFAFLTVVFVEIYYYMVIKYTNIYFYSAIVNRTVILLSVISSIYLASLWSRTASNNE